MNNSSLLLLLCILSTQLLFAQNTDTYHRVRVRLEGHTIQELSALGVETDHGEYVPHRHLTNDFSSADLNRLAEAGFIYEVLIRDVQDFYSDPVRRQVYQDNARGGDLSCPDVSNSSVTEYPIPSNFRLGDMAGFYRYQEMLDILDSMRLLYPNLITSRRIVSPSIVSHQGRPIYWMRISDNPDTDESVEPEVLYTALHHAREPNSLTQMVFYMWYLLENYESDQEVRYLVDNTELYFLPCINPDGYIFNETTEPDGGGMWRKNFRDNDDGSTGVDLNRNYGYQWGFDDEGSSPNPSSSTYRGTEAFSEPETQAVRAFCQEHEFIVALNYHTYGDLLIYPWGYSDSPTVDAPTFNTLGKVMTIQNDYIKGTGSETVGYVVNGDSDDWMYGETTEKPRIFSMTPEIGGEGIDGGFWPVREAIIPNSRASLWMNLMAANTPHVAGVAQIDPTQIEIKDDYQFLRFEVQRFGRENGPLSVSLTSLQNDLIQVVEEPLSFDLAENQAVIDSFALNITGSIAPGTELQFELAIDNGSFVRRDTVSKVYGGYINTVVYEEDFSGLDQWTTEEDWGLTNEDFVSGPNSLTDSPYSNYPNSHYAQITLNEPISVGEAEEYRLNFWAKWNIEPSYDWAQLQFQVNEGSWIPACGRYTVTASNTQATDGPLWEGQQNEWVEESVDLTPFLINGDQLRLRFLMVSDTYINPDGFYMDDLVFQERNMKPVSTEMPLGAEAFSLRVVPNPNFGRTQLQFRLPHPVAAKGQWQLFQAGGQLLQTGVLSLPTGYGEVDLEMEQLPAGIYWLKAQVGEYLIPTRKIVVVK
ncbi:M14 family metallopeptidase [Lewinella cohaerens]|uniref:M14 family metallopeptidase n=1 Tax=Lewinella cohaerens TaxID=70995 RepID=UPI0003827895|nr:M14 family metallopeptidase [Lewinella cohaerens]